MPPNDARPQSTPIQPTPVLAKRCTDLLGLAVVDLWGGLPHDVQQALFEQALRQEDGEGAEGPPMREELAKFLHQCHERTAHKETATV